MTQFKYKLGAGDLILNSPFEEPGKYWSYDRKYRGFNDLDGRRPAGYVVATPDAQGFDDPGRFVLLPLVNQEISKGMVPRLRVWLRSDSRAIRGELTPRMMPTAHYGRSQTAGRFSEAAP
jgi:type III restriction enzyme